MSRRKISRLILALGLTVALLASAAGAHAAPLTASGNGNQNALNGVYRITWTKEQMMAAGASREFAASDTLTLTLRGGRFRLQIKKEPALKCTGGYTLYTFAGSKRFSISLNNPVTCPDLNASFVATWSRPGGNLRFRIVQNRGEAGDEVLFGGKAWKKIG